VPGTTDFRICCYLCRYFKGGEAVGRSTRADHRGGIYHVIARGNNKEFIFHDDKDKGYFLSILKKSCEAMGCKVYGYVLMNNHYHILMQTMDKMLQEIMHKINNQYSKYFNLKYERVGHVFQGRYKSSIIQDETYMYNVLRYIHQNPIKAGFCEKVQDYDWCSDKYYRSHINSFIDISLIMEMLSRDSKEARKKYSEFMSEYNDENYDEMGIVGDEAFKILYDSRKKQVPSKKSLGDILLETGLNIDELNLIKEGSKKRSLTPYKIKYIRNALENKYSFAEIGAYIHVSGSAIQEILERYRNC
jgi:REP element-mobilizing transposase RayT